MPIESIPLVMWLVRWANLHRGPQGPRQPNFTCEALLDTSYATAKRSIGTLVDLGILTQSNAKHQSRIYVAFGIYEALRSVSGRG